jgi:hypothetical protein
MANRPGAPRAGVGPEPHERIESVVYTPRRGSLQGHKRRNIPLAEGAEPTPHGHIVDEMSIVPNEYGGTGERAKIPRSAAMRRVLGLSQTGYFNPDQLRVAVYHNDRRGTISYREIDPRDEEAFRSAINALGLPDKERDTALKNAGLTIRSEDIPQERGRAYYSHGDETMVIQEPSRKRRLGEFLRSDETSRRFMRSRDSTSPTRRPGQASRVIRRDTSSPSAEWFAARACIPAWPWARTTRARRRASLINGTSWTSRSRNASRASSTTARCNGLRSKS